MKINFDKTVEISHKLIPGQEFFGLEAEVSDVTKTMPEVKHRDDIWYILSKITLGSHIGTHIEFPYHHWREGEDAYDFPVEKLVGNCIALDFKHKKPGECITLDELKAASAKVQKGDIVFIKTGMDVYFGTDDWELQPYLAADALEWLITEKRPIVVGTDAAGFEVPGTDYQPNHLMIFKNGVGMIESATNLDALGDERALCFILPLQIKGIDSFPVRIFAIKDGGIEL